MVTQAENELMTRVEGDAPLGRLMRENYWVPFALSEHLVAGEAPTAVRLFGENFVAFRAENGEIGFFDELCPHRRASLLLGRIEGNGIRCIYHGWKMDVSGCVVECPTQTVRAEQFAASVRVAHFPVREVGGIAWVWLGGGQAPAFPDLPFAEEHGVQTALTFSVVRANWLQGLEGGLDSAHGPLLHATWIRDIFNEKSKTMDTESAKHYLASPPLYETEPAPFGLRTVSRRPADEGRTYIRMTHFYFPFVVVVPIGYPDHTQIFAFAPVDDTNYLLFFGSYGDGPQMDQQAFGAVGEGFEPDPRNFSSVTGDRSNRWGQDRELMKAGHFTGFGTSVIDEDAVVQVSMGPILDRTKENLSTSDVAVASARRLILETIAAVSEGELPPGSVRGEPVRIPHPIDAVIDADQSWRDVAPVG